MSRLLKNTKQDMEMARKLLTHAKVDLSRILEGVSLADPTPPGFLPKINSNRMGPAPPRPVQLLSPNSSWQHFQKLLDELLLACDVVKVMASLPNCTYVNNKELTVHLRPSQHVKVLCRLIL